MASFVYSYLKLQCQCLLYRFQFTTLMQVFHLVFYLFWDSRVTLQAKSDVSLFFLNVNIPWKDQNLSISETPHSSNQQSCWKRRKEHIVYLSGAIAVTLLASRLTTLYVRSHCANRVTVPPPLMPQTLTGMKHSYLHLPLTSSCQTDTCQALLSPATSTNSFWGIPRCSQAKWEMPGTPP